MTFQRTQCRQQVFAVSSEQVQTGNAFLSQKPCQRLVTGLLKHQHGAACHLQLLMDGNNELAVDRSQCLCFIVQTSIVVFTQCNF